MKYIRVTKGRKEYFLHSRILSDIFVLFKTSPIVLVPFSFYLQCAWDAFQECFFVLSLLSSKTLLSFQVSQHPILKNIGGVIKNEK